MKRILILSALLLLFISCQKREWGNPFDPNCAKELFTPTSFKATQMGDSIVLSWSQPNNQISGFVLEKNTADGSFTQLANPEKSTTKVADRNIEGGIKYGYQLYASAGSNTSNTVTVEITPLLNAKITTTAFTNITAASAIAGGNITADGGAAITSRGVCWSTAENPTIANSKTTDGTGKGSFTSSVTGLTAGTVHYARAYATNSVGTAYGNQVTTTTLTILPAITTSTLSAVTATTITGGGNITSDGGASVTARGVCWSITQNPTTANSKTTDGTGTGSFTSSISGLSPGVTYYIKAYAVNNVGTVYGTEVTTTTTAISPVITTATVSAITATTVTSGGNILSDGGATVTIRGVCWSTSQNPTISDNKTSNSTGSGIFVSSIVGLAPGVTYYLRAYATNSVGTSYGNQLTASTNATVSILTTTSPSAITSSTASTGGNITSDGGSIVTARGVCWGINANPTTANSKTTDGSGIGSFTSNIAGLTPGTTYYIRAYATNSIGTVYGSPISFITLPSGSLTVTDIDGNFYHTLPIGTQVWLVENLKTTKYQNGDPIQNSEWSIAASGAYSNYNNDANNSTTYGRLYNWPAITDSRNIAPIGWHVPSDDEWTILINYLGGMYVAGGKLKELGFIVNPGGYRNLYGSFFYLGILDSWWSTTEFSTQIDVLARNYDIRGNGIDRGVYNKLSCISVRCVRN